MDSVQTAKRLWRQKHLVALVFVIGTIVAVLVAYRISISPLGLHKRALQVGAASSQILVDTPRSTLVAGASPEKFDTLAARARVYGEYLSTLQARARIAAVSGVRADSITTSGPFSPESGQVSYENQTSASRADEILKEGAENRLVFIAQEGVPIITVDAQAATAATAIRLAQASFITLRQYVRTLERTGGGREATDGGGQSSGGPANGVTVRELGAPEGGTIGGSNGKVLMILTFLFVAALGCALILIVPGLVQRWRSLDELQLRREDPESLNGGSANGNLALFPDDELPVAPTERAAPRR